MAAGNLTLNPKRVATILSTNAAAYVITVADAAGFILNIGTKTAYLTDDGSTPAADGGQRVGEAPLPSNASYPIPKGCSQIGHVCAGADTTTLVFLPVNPEPGT